MSLIDQITSMLTGDDKVKNISQEVGANEEQTKSAIQSIIPMLIGGLSGKKEGGGSGGGKKNPIMSFLDKDGDGDIMDDLPGLFKRKGKGGGGAGNLFDSLFGDKKKAIEEHAKEVSGLDKKQSNKLIDSILPAIMDQIKQTKKDQNLSEEDVTNLLKDETEKAKKKTPGAMKFLTNLLDKDGDGDIMDDIKEKGGGFFKKFF